ncbi:hypothetical protein BC628DRAFT_1312436 [Trametes gibbosa]|uniref:Zinc finger protein 209 n=1 Tax=Trametes gibbosa TaxID=160864 RepID=A0A6B9KD13_9APHY|nr:hypothetical protein BC628DRAFT_1312436 [Trametes gibbosa]QHA24582.1 zinc finger protein 209 [Trametes gibbosa]
MAQTVHPKLPSVLPSAPALQDMNTTAEQVNAGHARVTNPTQTPIFICGLQDCYRLFRTRDGVMAHRKREHDSEDDEDIITWKTNE